MDTDVIVLGAGIIGVCTAAHLQKRGRAVVLVDRQAPGEGTSYGNAGVIQTEAVAPYAFPRNIGVLLRYAGNRRIDMHYHPAALPRVAPFLFRYWWHSQPQRYAAICRLYAPLIAESLREHRSLAGEAGASELIGERGSIQFYRTQKMQDDGFAHAERLGREFGVVFKLLGADELAKSEPHLKSPLAGGIHWTESASVTDPHELTLSYLALFERHGGVTGLGDARTLRFSGGRWHVATKTGSISAGSAVLALGASSKQLTDQLGYRLPLGVKRGYHAHYRPIGGAVLNHALLDTERGYALAPMRRGIRLTTGAEFSHAGAPPTPVQLARAEIVARDVFPLHERGQESPWMGCRPCTPDMLPVIGPAPKHNRLWFAFGHSHHGLTLGPLTGRLVAELMTGEPTLLDVKPYRADRF